VGWEAMATDCSGMLWGDVPSQYKRSPKGPTHLKGNMHDGAAAFIYDRKSFSDANSSTIVPHSSGEILGRHAEA